MRTIYKYEVGRGTNVIEMPIGARVLTVQSQYGKAFIWALIDTVNIDHVPRRFEAFETGESLGKTEFQYIGTFQLDGGSSIYHLFEDQD